MREREREQLNKEVYAAGEVKKLKSRFLDQFFADKEAQIFESIRSLPLGSDDDLQALHMMLKSLSALQAEINTVMNSGHMAEMSLNQELDKAEP